MKNKFLGILMMIVGAVELYSYYTNACVTVPRVGELCGDAGTAAAGAFALLFLAGLYLLWRGDPAEKTSA